MSKYEYTKQTWNDYDEALTLSENMRCGAVVTAEKMNHIEAGIFDGFAYVLRQAGTSGFQVSEFRIEPEDWRASGESDTPYFADINAPNVETGGYFVITFDRMSLQAACLADVCGSAESVGSKIRIYAKKPAEIALTGTCTIWSCAKNQE